MAEKQNFNLCDRGDKNLYFRTNICFVWWLCNRLYICGGGVLIPARLSVVSADIYSTVQGFNVLVSVHFSQVGSLVSFVTYIKMVLPIIYHTSVMVSLPHISLMLSYNIL